MMGYESVNDIQMSVQVIDPTAIVSVPAGHMFSPQHGQEQEDSEESKTINISLGLNQVSSSIIANNSLDELTHSMIEPCSPLSSNQSFRQKINGVDFTIENFNKLQVQLHDLRTKNIALRDDCTKFKALY